TFVILTDIGLSSLPNRVRTGSLFSSPSGRGRVRVLSIATGSMSSRSNTHDRAFQGFLLIRSLPLPVLTQNPSLRSRHPGMAPAIDCHCKHDQCANDDLLNVVGPAHLLTT